MVTESEIVGFLGSTMSPFSDTTHISSWKPLQVDLLTPMYCQVEVNVFKINKFAMFLEPHDLA